LQAFNDDGYKLSLLYFSDDELSIQLEAPEKMSEFKWPTNGIATILPIAKSTYGRIWSDTSKWFGINIGNTTINEFNDYVELCKSNGFMVNYVKEDRFFNAFNDNGDELTLRYLGFNRIEISLENDKEDSFNTPEKEDENQTTTDDNEQQATPTDNESQEANTTNSEEEKDEYSSSKYELEALILFRKTGEAQYPYGIEYHWLTGGIASEYQGNGSYYFRVKVTVTNQYGTKRKGTATGYVDVRINYIDFSVGLD